MKPKQEKKAKEKVEDPFLEQLSKQEPEECGPWGPGSDEEMAEMERYFNRPATPPEEIDESKLPF